MGSDSDSFCLKWNDFPGSISSTLGSLRASTSPLQDVTLQCGTESLKAHRLVLALCSDWFRTVLESLPLSTLHPVLVLWDTSAGDMALLCDFMYNGQVNVQQERLSSFLALATRLEVKGLSQGPEERKEDEWRVEKERREETDRSNVERREKERKEKEKRIEEKRRREAKEARPGIVVPVLECDVEEEGLVMKEEQEDTSYPMAGLDYPLGQEEAVQGRSEAMTGYSENMLVASADYSPRGGGNCPICHKHVAKLAYHMEDVHYPVDTPCTVCGKVFSSLNKMRSHKSSQHRVAPARPSWAPWPPQQHQDQHHD